MKETLERIAVALEALVRLHTEQHESMLQRQDACLAEHKAFARARAKLLSLLEEDRRFPGLSTKVQQSPEPMSAEAVVLIVDRPDPVALINHLVSKPNTLRKMDGMDKDAIGNELARIEQRLAMAALPPT